jgi:hypothetical protein
VAVSAVHALVLRVLLGSRRLAATPRPAAAALVVPRPEPPMSGLAATRAPDARPSSIALAWRPG